MEYLNIRTTFDKNALPDSHEIRIRNYKLLATKYNKRASQIEIWNRKKNCINRSIVYKPLRKLTHINLKHMFINAILSE